MEQRKLQKDLLNTFENGKKESKEFLFPEDDFVRHRRRPSTIIESHTDCDENTNLSESQIVIEFDPQIHKTSLHWIIDKIRMKKSDGGAQLLMKREPSLSDDKGLIIHVSASRNRLLELADEIGFTKQTKQGMKNFNIGSLDDFIYEETMTADDILTPAEKQFAVKYALESIKATADEKHIPGNNSIQLYHGQSIIHASLTNELIVDMYSLHDKKFIRRLGHEWWDVKNIMKSQPIDKIRYYFGDAIGIYFAFVGFYTTALLWPTIFGFFQFLLDEDRTILICCFNVIWMTIFLELWKRKNSQMAYNWGSLALTNVEIPRPDYYGVIGTDPITGKKEPQYPKWKTLCQFGLVSVPIILLLSSGMAFMALYQFWIEEYLLQRFPYDSYIHFLPSVAQAILVAILTILYDMFATYLTIKENHKTQAQYERYRVMKLIVLEFVNNFFSLFYLAFVKRDKKMLQNQLMTQMVILQFVQNIQEFLLPKLKQKFYLYCHPEVKTPTKKAKSRASLYDNLNIRQLESDDPLIHQNVRESAKDQYETYDDYLELYIQFGYVVLFSSITPFAAFWALLNNFIEIRLDAYKLCKTFRRPLAKRAKNTGAWQTAFEVLACLSIMTNCGILYMTPELSDFIGETSIEQKLLVVVGIEHVLLLTAWIIHKAIPDRPGTVRVALARSDYESKQALKRENALRTKHVILRRFKSSSEQ